VIAIEVDPVKDVVNRRRQFDYGEERWLAVGRIGDQVFTACYTMRGRVYRIISLRRASRKERQAYAQAYP
jgi:uncharacterized protein